MNKEIVDFVDFLEGWLDPQYIEWLTEKILERDKAMRKEAFEAGRLTSMVPRGDGIQEPVDYVEEAVYETFDEFEKDRRKSNA